MFRNFTMSICAAILVASFGAVANAQSATLSLDLFYSNPGDTTSAGTWQLYATADSEGVSGVAVHITGIMGDPEAMFLAPAGPGFREFYNGGTVPFDSDNHGDASTLEMLIAQVPLPSPGPQNLLYDAGKLGGTTPLAQAELGTVVDTSGSIMTDAVLLAFGKFGANSTPAFDPSEVTVNVFTVEGTATDAPPLGSIVVAALTTQVRDNTLTLVGDTNLDKTVDGLDLNILGGNWLGMGLWQDSDFNGDKAIDGLDLNALGGKWLQTAPFSGLVAAVVPEPSSVALVCIGICAAVGLRRRSSRTV